MIQRIHIVGGGSAGFMVAMALKSRLPDTQVTVIRSMAIGIIGVGEGSTPGLTRFLHNYLGVPSAQFLKMAQPTWKLGLKFIWGQRPYFNYTFTADQLTGRVPGLPLVRAAYCDDDMTFENTLSALMTFDRVFERNQRGEPIITPDLAYHIENDKYVAFLEAYARSQGIEIIDDTITEVGSDESGITFLRLSSGKIETADLYVDASGFKSLLLGQTLHEPFVSFASTLFCDRAVVGGWDRQDAADEVIQPYTVCETMSSGWCWRIDHAERINRGYVYASAFISDEEAEREFRASNPKVGATRIVKFIAGRYARTWVKNVVAVGNAAGFVEPLEATSLGTIEAVARTLAGTLVESQGHEVTASVIREFNTVQAAVFDDIRSFLGVHYRFNGRMETPFWRHCRAETDLAGAERVVEMYRENGPSIWLETAVWRGSIGGAPGYVAMLHGQQVEHRRAPPMTPAQQARWNEVRLQNRQAAERAISVREALVMFGVAPGNMR
jgi:tryptophan halogenase